MTTIRTLKTLTLAALLGACLALPAIAQPGAGWGGGPGAQGSGPGAGPGAGGPGYGMQPGTEPGRGRGHGHGMRANQRNTAGWALMSAEERSAHRDKMRNLKSYDECRSVQAEQHMLMQARAKEKGMTLPEPRTNACERMKQRGVLK